MKFLFAITVATAAALVPTAFMSHDHPDRTIVLLMMSGLVFVGCYNYLGSRNVFADLVIVEIFPQVLVRLFFTLGSSLWPSAKSSPKIQIQTWRQFLADPNYQRILATGRTVVLGRNEERIVTADLREDRHLLITGKTGEGKTTVILNMLFGLLFQGPRILSKMEFVILDPNKVLGSLKILDEAYSGIRVHTSDDGILGALESLVEEKEIKTRAMAKHQVFSADELGIAHKLVLIDEPQILFKKGKQYQDLIGTLVQTGRKAGFHIIMVTPYGKATVIDTAYRGNFRLISAFMPKSAERVVDMPVSKLPKLHFAYHEDERREPIVFMPFKIDSQDLRDIITRMLNSQTDPQQVALHLFMTTSNCGRRTILRHGLRHYQALLRSGEIEETPFPWSECSREPDHFGFTADAQRWAEDFLKKLERLGIAGPVETRGKARERLVEEEEAKRRLNNDND